MSNTKKIPKILFSGGGTLGPVTPLLAMSDMIRHELADVSMVWVGTKTGPERELVEKNGMRFIVMKAGKFRRYISWWNLWDLFRLFFGFWQALILLWRENPSVCISAGGFVSVPLHYAAWWLGIPTWIHQQDVHVGLANRLMAPFARIITVALEEQTNHFSKHKTHWLGNPVRHVIAQGNKAEAMRRFGLTPGLPIVFVTGGGTGSLRVNQLTVEAVPHLLGSCQIVHLFGKERPRELVEQASRLFTFYHAFPFFTTEMADVYAAADVVVSRGGFGTLTEIASLKKAAILLPKAGHQEENVGYLVKANAAISLDERTANGYHLAVQIKRLLTTPQLREQLGTTMHRILPVAKPGAVMKLLYPLLPPPSEESIETI